MIYDITNFLGNLLGWLCFLTAGFALGRFALSAYGKAVWQVQAALVLGFFLMVVGIVDFASSGMDAAFLLGAGLAFLQDWLGKNSEEKKED